MKNLKIKTRCPRPFDTVTIDKNGNVYACECSSWLPVIIGNLQLQELSEIIESDRLKNVQDSIIDNTYKHCNENLCSWLLDTREETKSWSTNIPFRQLKNIRLGIDNSCNLSCPSCRTQQIFEKKGTRLKSRIRMAKKIISYLESTSHDITVHLGSDGDPFASLVYRYFLQNCPKKLNISFSIQTNGLLIKKMYHRNEWMFKKLKILGLSIDGCTKEVYENLRRGGNFKILCENLEFLKSIKSKHNFKIQFHCVVQKENYNQMPEYINFAKNYLADRIWFNRIVDWKTLDNFKNYDVADLHNPLHNEFVSKLQIVKKMSAGQSKIIEFPTLDIL